jgi:RNA polymerase sigma-70 factor, ECF subfamily
MTPPAADALSPAQNESDARVSVEPPDRVIGSEKDGGFQDEDWLVRAARTDRQAFGVLYDRYFEAVYHYVARRVGDAGVAEDITSAVWERALTAIERYEIRGVPFAAWLYRIAGNLVTNHHRQRRLWRFVPLLSQHAADTGGVEIEEESAVRAAFRSLSSADQEALSLFYFAGLTPPEMATVLDCSVPAVHKRLHRARGRLREQLEGVGHGDAEPA